MSTMSKNSIVNISNSLNKASAQIEGIDERIKASFNQLVEKLVITNLEISKFSSSLGETFSSINIHSKSTFSSISDDALDSFNKIKNAAEEMKNQINASLSGIQDVNININSNGNNKEEGWFGKILSVGSGALDIMTAINTVTDFKRNTSKFRERIAKGGIFNKKIFGRNGKEISNLKVENNRKINSYSDASYGRKIEPATGKVATNNASSFRPKQEVKVTSYSPQQTKPLQAASSLPPNENSSKKLTFKKTPPQQNKGGGFRQRRGKWKGRFGKAGIAALVAGAIGSASASSYDPEDDLYESAQNYEGEEPVKKEEGFFSKALSWGSELISNPIVGTLGRVAMGGFRIARMATPLGWASLAAEAALSSDFVQDKIGQLFSGGGDDDQSPQPANVNVGGINQDIQRVYSVAPPNVNPNEAVGMRSSVSNYTLNNSPNIYITVPPGIPEQQAQYIGNKVAEGTKQGGQSTLNNLNGM